MTTQAYQQASQRFLAQAKQELAAGDLQQASEKGWGATAQILKAVAEQRGWEHSQHRHHLVTVSRLRAETGAGDIRRLFNTASALHENFEEAELEEDAKRTVILKLHSNKNVGQLLLQRCGINSRCLTGNGARTLSRRLRDEAFSPALTRNLLEHLGNDPDTYYMIGADYRIPEPSDDGRIYCIQALQEAGFSDDRIESALSTLGVPPGGHHPPKRSSKKDA